MRPRLAPSAVRRAISACRIAVRVYTRIATFRQTSTSSRHDDTLHRVEPGYVLVPCMPRKGLV